MSVWSSDWAKMSSFLADSPTRSVIELFHWTVVGMILLNTLGPGLVQQTLERPDWGGEKKAGQCVRGWSSHNSTDSFIKPALHRPVAFSSCEDALNVEKVKQSDSGPKQEQEHIEAPEEEDDRLLQTLSEACGSTVRHIHPQVHRVMLFCFFACPWRLRQPSLEGLQDSWERFARCVAEGNAKSASGLQYGWFGSICTLLHTVLYGSTVPDSRFVATLCKYKEHTPDEGSFTTCYSSGQSRWDTPLLLSSAAPKCAAFACQVLTVQATWHLRSSIVLVQSWRPVKARRGRGRPVLILWVQ